MKKLSVFAMAVSSSVLMPAAVAQTVSNSNPHNAVADKSASQSGSATIPAQRVAPSAGHSWRAAQTQAHHAPSAMHHSAPSAQVQGGHMETRQTHRMGASHHKGGRFAQIRRIDRGGMIPHSWFAPRYHVRNWSLYGFPQPFGGGRWVRYYDDALLIDQYGRVLDGRYGVDWEVEDERWGYDDNGVPAYVGDGDFQPDEDDYDWAEDYERDEGRDGKRRRFTYAYPGYGVPYDDCGCDADGYGPVLMTETIVTTAPVVESVTRYEYVEERPVYRSKSRKAVRRSN